VHFLMVAVTNASISSGRAVLTIDLNYSGTVPLTDFKLKVFGEELDFGTVVKGHYERELEVPPSVLAGGMQRPDMEMEFKVAGIYRLKVAVKGSRYGA